MSQFIIENIDKYVGTRLRERRISLGLTQSDLAKKNGITFQQIQKYERGVNRIGAGRLYNFSKNLNVQINYFYEGFEEASDFCENYEENNEMKETSYEALKAIAAFNKINDKKIQKAILDFLVVMSKSKK